MSAPMTPAKAQRILYQYEEDIFNPTLKVMHSPDLGTLAEKQELRDALELVHRFLRKQAAQAAAEPAK